MFRLVNFGVTFIIKNVEKWADIDKALDNLSSTSLLSYLGLLFTVFYSLVKPIDLLFRSPQFMNLWV